MEDARDWVDKRNILCEILAGHLDRKRYSKVKADMMVVFG